MRYAVVFTKNQFQYLKHFIQQICEVSPPAEAEIYLHSQPLKAIHAAEQMLNHDPTNVLLAKQTGGLFALQFPNGADADKRNV